MPVARIEIVARRLQRIRAAPFAEYSIVHVRAGIKRIRDDRGETDIPAGGYFAVGPASLLHVENLPAADGPYRAVCLSVPEQTWRAQRLAADPAARPWMVLPAQATLSQAFAHAEQGLNDRLDESLLRHRVAELLTAAALAGFRFRQEPQQRSGERLRLLLNAQPARDWRATDAARQLAVSEATLRRRLAAEQTSFRAVLEEVRLSHALTLVQGSAKPLKLIAAECGYASPSRFATRFRTRFGCPPSELRG